MNYEEFIKDLEVLFQYDNYEEICYPIVRTYFLYKIGKLPKEDMGQYDRETLGRAFSILAQERYE